MFFAFLFQREFEAGGEKYMSSCWWRTEYKEYTDGDFRYMSLIHELPYGTTRYAITDDLLDIERGKVYAEPRMVFAIMDSDIDKDT